MTNKITDEEINKRIEFLKEILPELEEWQPNAYKDHCALISALSELLELREYKRNIETAVQDEILNSTYLTQRLRC